MTYEFLVATAIGVLVAGGIYLTLRARTFQVVLGLTLISYAVNLFLFAAGRLVVGAPPLWEKGVDHYTDPLPQALVLTAIVITFGMTALVVVLTLRSFLETGSDHVDGVEVPTRRPEELEYGPIGTPPIGGGRDADESGQRSDRGDGERA